MKTFKTIVFLILIFAFSCKNEKNTTTEIESDSRIENKVSKTKSNTKNSIYRKITELDKYKEYTEIVGVVLDGTDKALSYIQKDSIQVLVLEQIIKDNSPKSKFKILDEVRIIANKAKLFSEPADCELIDNPKEKFIFGITNDQEKEYFDQDYILKVWKVNLAKNKFEEIDKHKVKCFNQWFGYDG